MEPSPAPPPLLPENPGWDALGLEKGPALHGHEESLELGVELHEGRLGHEGEHCGGTTRRGRRMGIKTAAFTDPQNFIPASTSAQFPAQPV